jgi:predicted anti-sigma-YlaC factor YlaD
MSSFARFLLMAVAVAAVPGCSLKTYAINMVGDALSSGDSVYETDNDLELVGAALPFGLKLTESLLAQSPDHRGLLLTACRGFTLYSYAYVGHAAEVAAEDDLDRARSLRVRARRLYLRGFDYCMRAVERSYPGLKTALAGDAAAAVERFKKNQMARDLPFIYWSAASLGLAISVSKHDAVMLGRLPEVRALLDRALELDETWDGGALHEFKIVLAAATPGAPDVALIRRHYARALELSAGKSSSVHLALAEAVSVPLQNGAEFRDLIQRALAVDPDASPENRLVNLLAHRRALWLAARVDELILENGADAAEGR